MHGIYRLLNRVKAHTSRAASILRSGLLPLGRRFL
ncbi:hypothetical protein [Akkermansia phage Chambord]|nr:hypothetical protein [Akkermansia phage Chambord]